jgi:chloride channel protein, CIC family
VPALHDAAGALTSGELLCLALLAGAAFGLAALALIESMRGLGRLTHRLGERRPYVLAAAGGVLLFGLYSVAGPEYAGLGSATIEGVLAGTAKVALGAFLLKILATSVTLETGGSGGIVTPIFFVGATCGAALAHVLHMPQGLLASFGLVAVLAAAANTPIAASVMGMELLPASEGVYAALAAGTAFLIVGHRSVYASQKLGLSKSAGLDVTLDVAIGSVGAPRIRKGSLTDRVHTLGRRWAQRGGGPPAKR